MSRVPLSTLCPRKLYLTSRSPAWHGQAREEVLRSPSQPPLSAIAQFSPMKDAHLHRNLGTLMDILPFLSFSIRGGLECVTTLSTCSS